MSQAARGARPRVKVCGLTRAGDALVALEAGADYLGFIFAAASPRRITPSAAAALVASLPRGRAELVGVFVNETVERINAIAREVGLTMVQLHGDETPEGCAGLDVPAIKVLRLPAAGAGEQREADAARALALALRFSTPFLMIEPRVEGRYGGTGRTADWGLAAALVERLAARVFLAGGLSPDNVVEAIAAVRPFAVDASSSLETAPGVKDPARVRAFVEAVKRS